MYCFEYIEQFYNNYNPHSANNGLTPNQKEENYFRGPERLRGICIDKK